MNRDDFEALMRDVDRSMLERGVPIVGRPLAAIREVSKRLRRSLPIHVPGFPAKAIAGDFRSGLSVTGHVLDWINARYGKRLGIDACLGYCVVGFFGDAWLVRVPYLVGGPIYPGWHCELLPSGAQNIVREGGRLNVLDAVVGLTPILAREIPANEAQAAVDAVVDAYTVHKAFAIDLKQHPMARVVHEDLNSSAKKAMERGTRAMSRWDSLQAAEKALKLYISQYESFRYTHNLTGLVATANRLGLPKIPDSVIEAVQCDAGVRYGDTKILDVSIFLRANRCAFMICRAIVDAMRVGRPPAVDPRPDEINRPNNILQHDEGAG